MDHHRVRLRVGPRLFFLPNANVFVRVLTTNQYRTLAGALDTILAFWPGLPLRIESAEVVP